LSSRNAGSINPLTISIAGLPEVTAPVVRDMDGQPLAQRWRTWMATAGPSCMST
jgi:hypothetical protein